jgi:hypothetical protein
VISAVSIADAARLDESDIFDLEGAYTLALATTTRDDSRQGYFHPSGVGGCRRKQVYEYIRTPFIPTLNPDSLEIFDMGHAVHELVGRKLADVARVLKPKNMGYSFRPEVTFDPAWDTLFSDLGIGGTCDGIIEIWTDTWRQRSILEIKSINKDGFEKLSKPKHDHLMQAHLYAYRFDCPIVYNWYYCKDNSKRRVYASPFNVTVFHEAIDYFEKLRVHVEAGTLPERDEDFFECPRCPYRETCQPSMLANANRKENAAALSQLRNRGRL